MNHNEVTAWIMEWVKTLGYFVSVFTFGYLNIPQEQLSILGGLMLLDTITGLTRDLSQTADPATGGTGLDWAAGTQIILVAMHDQLPDKNETTASAWTQNWKVWVFKAAVS